jgi:type IV secretion system protein VirB2
MLNYPDSLSSSVNWIEGLLTGSLAISVAMLAIAALGMLLLTGRVPLRRGAAVVLGCFVLFSARVMADGLIGVPVNNPVEAASTALSSYTPTQPAPVPYDPYAGAAVPLFNSQLPIR